MVVADSPLTDMQSTHTAGVRKRALEGDNAGEWIENNLFLLMGTLVGCIIIFTCAYLFCRARKRHQLEKKVNKYEQDDQNEDTFDGEEEQEEVLGRVEDVVEEDDDEDPEGSRGASKSATNNPQVDVEKALFDFDEKTTEPVLTPPLNTSTERFRLENLQKQKPRHRSMAFDIAKKLKWADVATPGSTPLILMQAALDAILKWYTVTLTRRTVEEKGATIFLNGCSWNLLPAEAKLKLIEVLSNILLAEEIIGPHELVTKAEKVCVLFQTEYRRHEVLTSNFAEIHLHREAKRRIKRHKSAFELSQTGTVLPNNKYNRAYSSASIAGMRKSSISSERRESVSLSQDDRSKKLKRKGSSSSKRKSRDHRRQSKSRPTETRRQSESDPSHKEPKPLAALERAKSHNMLHSKPLAALERAKSHSVIHNEKAKPTTPAPLKWRSISDE